MNRYCARSLLAVGSFTCYPAAIGIRKFASSITDTESAVNRLLNEPKKIKLREFLQSDPRFRITKEEYIKTAASVGLSNTEAEDFLTCLDKAAVVNIFPQAEQFVFLKPDLTTKHLIDVLDPEATYTQQRVLQLRKDLEINENLKSALDAVKTPLDKKAEKSLIRMLWACTGGMIAYSAGVARLTWWELSWDIVEPMTYMVTISTTIGIFIYFCLTRTEYNYNSAFRGILQRKKEKLYQRNGFDIEKYNQVCDNVTKLTLALEKYGETWNLPPHAISVDIFSDETHLVEPQPKA